MTEFINDLGAVLVEGWVLIPVAMLGGLMCWGIGFRMGRRFQARQFVTRAVERSVAETVPIPSQRGASS